MKSQSRHIALFSIGNLREIWAHVAPCKNSCGEVFSQTEEILKYSELLNYLQLENVKV